MYGLKFSLFAVTQMHCIVLMEFTLNITICGLKVKNDRGSQYLTACQNIIL